MFNEVDIDNNNYYNEINVLTMDDLDLFLIYGFNTIYVMDELHHDRNDEEFPIMTDYLPITDAGDFALKLRKRLGMKIYYLDVPL